MPRPKKNIEEQESTEVTDEVTQENAEPKKKKKQNMAGDGAVFDIFSMESKQDQKRDLLAKAKMADGFRSAAELSRAYLPVPWLAMQYLISRPGFPVNTVVEFIGEENIGKSSLMLACMTNFMKHNMPCLWINCDGKEIEGKWIRHLAGSDKTIADRIAKLLDHKNMYTLNEMDAFTKEWVRMYREDLGVPHEIPLVICIDAITMLATPDEDEKFYTVDKTTKEKKLSDKGVADLSNQPGQFAKWMHAWKIELKGFMEKQNVTIFMTSNQNIKMNAGPVAGFNPDAAKKMNKTRRGGTAMNGLASFQITLTRKGQLKDSSNTNIGNIVCANVVKSSYGCYNMIEYGLRNKKLLVDGNYCQQAFEMDKAFAEILIANKMYNLTCTRAKYNSDELGLHQVEPSEVCSRIANDEDLLYKTCNALGISGYEE